jgi:hypothetical protein
MKSLAILFLGLMLTGQTPVAGKIETTFDKQANFAAFHTYSWGPGKDAFLPEGHKMIVAAVDKQMAAQGLTPVATGGDVTIAYYTTTTSNIDLKALDKIDERTVPAPTKELGKLIVVMRDAKTRAQLWSAGTHEFLDSDRSKLGASVQAITELLFATYPGRARK